MTIVSNTDVRNAEAFALPEIGGDHFRSSAVFLTQSHPKQTQGSDVFAGTSLDQLYAKRSGQDTPMPSMQLCIENLDQAGGCTYDYSCAYTDSISWASPSEPLPMIRDPRVVFDMLFGVGARPKSAPRGARRAAASSTGSAARWSASARSLGTGDRARLDRYLDNVREIERRIQTVEAHNTQRRGARAARRAGRRARLVLRAREADVRPAGARLQTDMTRVFSFKIGRDAQNRVFPESGSNQPFHPASHHGDREDRIMEFTKIYQYHVSLMAYFLEKLKSTMDGDGSLLDKSMVIYGSPMGDSNIHNHRRCPLVLFGHANGAARRAACTSRRPTARRWPTSC